MAYEGLKLSAKFQAAKAAPARTLAKTIPAAAAKISPPAISSARFTQADMDRAVASAVAANTATERGRIASVFANEASYGRERGCITLLTSPKNFSTAMINTNLADMPRDNPRANVSTTHRVTKTAMGGSGKPQTPAEQAATTAQWDKVIASMFPNQGK